MKNLERFRDDLADAIRYESLGDARPVIYSYRLLEIIDQHIAAAGFAESGPKPPQDAPWQDPDPKPHEFRSAITRGAYCVVCGHVAEDPVHYPKPAKEHEGRDDRRCEAMQEKEFRLTRDLLRSMLGELYKLNPIDDPREQFRQETREHRKQLCAMLDELISSHRLANQENHESGRLTREILQAMRFELRHVLERSNTPKP